MFWSLFSDVTNLAAWFSNNASFLPETSCHLHCRLSAFWFMAASYQLYHVTISLVLRERVTLGILCLLLLKKWLRNYIFRVCAFIKTAQKDWEHFFCCYSSSDDCLSCVQREFKVEELKKKACLEFDFGEILVMIMQFSVLKKGEEWCGHAQKHSIKRQ